MTATFPFAADPLVGAVILNYRRDDLTAQAVQSFLDSGYPRRRLVIFDNDEDEAAANRLGARFPEIPILRSGRNLGFAEGNNLGIQHLLSQGVDCVFLLNSDAVVEKDSLRLAVEFMRKEREAGRKTGIVGARVVFEDDPRVVDSIGAWLNLKTGRIFHRGHGKPFAAGGRAIVEPDAVSGCAMLLDAGMLREIGLFPPGYFAYFEDVELCLRAREKGWRIVTALDCVVRHRGSASTGGGSSPERVYYCVRNQLRMLEEHAPIRSTSRRALRRMFVVALWAAFVLCAPMPKGKAFRLLWKGWRDFLAGRSGPLAGSAHL